MLTLQVVRVIGSTHRGKGREIIALDWTFSYHPYRQKNLYS